MPCSLKVLLPFCLCLLIPLNATAGAVKNDKLTCLARHLDTDQLVEVKTVSGIGIAMNKVATAQWPLGYPTIVIDDSAFVKLPKNAKQFVYYHECAHLKFTIKDEHTADCESVNLLVEKHAYAELDIRRLMQSLSKEFGWSRRWQELLNCESSP